MHKDYGSGVPIQISVYEDKIYFWNDGQLPEDWTIEHLLNKHPSKPYNPLIANAFFRVGLIESGTSGTSYSPLVKHKVDKFKIIIYSNT